MSGTHTHSGGPAILEVSGLHARIAGQLVVEDVSFTVPAHGVTALLGRNGVGKTSTLKALLGLNDRTGTVIYQGRRIDHWPTHRIVQAGIGYVPEDREVFPGLTVEQNLKLAERTARPDYSVVDRLFPELRQRAAQRAGTLSGGQQQMVSLARVLINTNDLLLVDEPTKGLAPRIVHEVTGALQVAAATTPMLLVEQNLAVVRELADTVVVLSGGRVVHAGNATAFLDDPHLVNAHLGVSTGAPEQQHLAATAGQVAHHEDHTMPPHLTDPDQAAAMADTGTEHPGGRA
ncbi:ABC transporter ATP-binding protein [Propionibacteriaceae bacterium G1746]|uniref:ABC transporter ATP-binding protein n=1 Tax=Aestuariimicrobium sp. G57 TaxID=3418485 RepID=UPI003C26E41B